MLKIEFLYYDKSTCRRCISTDRSVKLTLRELKKVIKNAKVKVDFKEKKLPKSKTHLSPSILINGKDVEKMVSKNSKLKSNVCSDCCQLTGHSVNCRTFSYRGRSCDYMPKRMIMEAVKIVLRTR
ncbi:hypothetical protein A3K64_03285 [Candidatus Micrarchaeota archaeon RBG_16_36_9]|nr:MAG: hypothetical protein A3K64_03285 [Candidatus Micrarchaeota archaeon RBG_16_36_9]